jgi:hypothetical protein
MNLGENHEFDGILNTTRTQEFLNNGIINERLNKLFTGMVSNIKHKSVKDQLAIRLRQAKMIDNKIKKL